MIWYANLHTLSTGKAMFTAYLGERVDDDIEPGDEVDFVADDYLEGDELIEALLDSEEYRELYADNDRLEVVGIVNQSNGYIVVDKRVEMGML